ncbi:hypothetical protein Barb6XT_01864 [Bacteroidales bacterium Barb6XT]|nr:hypothetical protein Barb6XT_01864 [Bacteroidales bacterium Barb6XT]
MLPRIRNIQGQPEMTLAGKAKINKSGFVQIHKLVRFNLFSSKQLFVPYAFKR